MDFFGLLKALKGKLLYAELGKPWPSKSHPLQMYTDQGEGFMVFITNEPETLEWHLSYAGTVCAEAPRLKLSLSLTFPNIILKCWF